MNQLFVVSAISSEYHITGLLHRDHLVQVATLLHWWPLFLDRLYTARQGKLQQISTPDKFSKQTVQLTNSAPCSSRTSATSVCPFSHAYVKAVSPDWVWAWMLAPCSTHTVVLIISTQHSYHRLQQRSTLTSNFNQCWQVGMLMRLESLDLISRSRERNFSTSENRD